MQSKLKFLLWLRTFIKAPRKNGDRVNGSGMGEKLCYDKSAYCRRRQNNLKRSSRQAFSSDPQTHITGFECFTHSLYLSRFISFVLFIR